MKVQLKRIDNAFKMKATNESGEVTYLDGSAAIGADGSAFRPMQLLLTSLAGCSSIDVINILNKQRQRIDDIQIDVSGERKEGIPSPFTSIEVKILVKGKVKEQKLARAIELTRTKYCSVYFSLHPDIDIRYTYELESVD